jgi:hypothetical protein
LQSQSLAPDNIDLDIESKEKSRLMTQSNNGREQFLGISALKPLTDGLSKTNGFHVVLASHRK